MPRRKALAVHVTTVVTSKFEKWARYTLPTTLTVVSVGHGMIARATPPARRAHERISNVPYRIRKCLPQTRSQTHNLAFRTHIGEANALSKELRQAVDRIVEVRPDDKSPRDKPGAECALIRLVLLASRSSQPILYRSALEL
jgi:hypothetical protein